MKEFINSIIFKYDIKEYKIYNYSCLPDRYKLLLTEILLKDAYSNTEIETQLNTAKYISTPNKLFVLYNNKVIDIYCKECIEVLTLSN